MKWDLPDPKKPETQTPIFPATSGSPVLSIASQYLEKKRRKC